MTPVINISADIEELKAQGLLHELLHDRSGEEYIIWATGEYAALGEEYMPEKPILPALLSDGVIKTRAEKDKESRDGRTKTRGEVFTPFSVCRDMCAYAMERLLPNKSAACRSEFIDSRILEICCGEAPFITTRYGAESGEIIAPDNRAGILDIKMKLIAKRSRGRQSYIDWAYRALMSVYGYELSGDNLLISRVNVYKSWAEHIAAAGYELSLPEAAAAAHIISNNFFQMDALIGLPPFAKPTEQSAQLTMFGEPPDPKEAKVCRVYNYLERKDYKFGDKEMKFDFIIGNPPYQEPIENTSDSPIYNYFMDEAYKIGDEVELITPARFLFDAGKTPKAWNQKMLNDPHLKVVEYEPDSTKIFPNADIKGGVAVTYRNKNKNFGAIETFTAFEELNSILHKVKEYKGFSPLENVITTSFSYKFTDKMHEENPNVKNSLSKGHYYDIVTNIFEKAPELFYDEIPNDSNKYIKLYGLNDRKRIYKYMRADYVKAPNNFNKWKIFVPKANGSGALGEVITTPVIGQPVIGHTNSFISMGAFASEAEANACLNYIKTKFARAMLGILKVTQDNTPSKWKYVPLQDFTSNSDIDWSKSIPEIDRQLYKKYGLDKGEMEFIESMVKEMA